MFLRERDNDRPSVELRPVSSLRCPFRRLRRRRFVDTTRGRRVSDIRTHTHTHTRRARATAPHRRRRKQAPEGVSARSGNIDTSFSRSRAEKVQAPSFKAGQWPRRTSRSFKAELKPDSIVFNGIGRLRRRLLELSATALRVNLAQCAAINRYNA